MILQLLIVQGFKGGNVIGNKNVVKRFRATVGVTESFSSRYSTLIATIKSIKGRKGIGFYFGF